MELADVREAARTGNGAGLHDETARHHGDLPAIEHHGTVQTHEDLRVESAQFAGALGDLGLEPGDVVVQYLLNCPAYLVGALGALKAGLAVSPANPMYTKRELAYQIDDANADAVLTHAALLPQLRSALAECDCDPEIVAVESDADDVVTFADARGEARFVERADDDLAMLPYTSGTTGQPKGVRLTHRNFRAQLSMVLAQSSDLAADEIRSLVWLPLYHITGFTHAAWQPLVRGGSIAVRSAAEWDAEACLSLLEAREISHFVGVTTMYVDLVEAEGFASADLSALEWAAEGGAKLSHSVQKRFESVTGVDMIEGYGLTETHGVTHAQANATFGLRPGTVGQPTRLTDCKIVDDDGAEVPPGEAGELLVRGPHVMAGYHDRPAATEAAFTERGYLHTGDVARRDADNYYEIVDRKTDVIVSAGYNVYPSEVEDCLDAHAAVAESAVVGVPDERRNEVPTAFVVTSSEAVPGEDSTKADPGEDPTEADLLDFLADRLAAYKQPRAVAFVDSLPRTTSGKVKKYELEEREAATEGEG